MDLSNFLGWILIVGFLGSSCNFRERDREISLIGFNTCVSGALHIYVKLLDPGEMINNEHYSDKLIKFNKKKYHVHKKRNPILLYDTVSYVLQGKIPPRTQRQPSHFHLFMSSPHELSIMFILGEINDGKSLGVMSLILRTYSIKLVQKVHKL